MPPILRPNLAPNPAQSTVLPVGGPFFGEVPPLAAQHAANVSCSVEPLRSLQTVHGVDYISSGLRDTGSAPLE